MAQARAGRSYKILVAEDNPTIRVIIEAILIEAGHRPDTVADGRQASDALQRQHYDVVILDKNMPWVTGIEVCAQFKSTHPDNGPMFILLSADTTGGTIKAAQEAGFAHVLTKPVESALLVKIFNDLQIAAPSPLFTVDSAAEHQLFSL